ncbi:MAG TPA: NAD(P)-dependent oxidoreductase [Anaerolineae bacterium]|nr:NAD(P)-dependent oxidoreductase [Anaerolineae bacterium]
MSERFLITGATGFVGQHLVRRVLDTGNEVIALDYAPNPAVLTNLGERATLVRGDVSDAETLHRIFETYHPQVVAHLAYLLPPETETAPERALQINLMGLQNVLDAARVFGVRRVVWTSSISVYGPAYRYPNQPVDEDAPTFPTSLYGATKVMAESLSRHYANQFGLSVVALRANLVYGPGRVRGLGEFKIWSRDLFEGAARGEPVTVPCGDQCLDWIYVTDFARALQLACAVATLTHSIFNISGEWSPVRQAVESVQHEIPNAPLKLESGTLAPERQPPAFSGARARLELGFTPEYSLAQGVRAFLKTISQQIGQKV